jgi:hypothetical protein
MSRFSKDEVLAALEHKLAQAEDRERDLSDQLAAANTRVIELIGLHDLICQNLQRWFTEEFISGLSIPNPGWMPATFGNIGPPDGSARFVYE